MTKKKGIDYSVNKMKEMNNLRKDLEKGRKIVMKKPPYRCVWCHADVTNFEWIGDTDSFHNRATTGVGLSWKLTCSQCDHSEYI